MENITTPSVSELSKEARRTTPWGIFIGLILILAIVVLGAFYTFSKRYVPPATQVVVQSK